MVGTGADGGLTATSSASAVLYAGSSIAVSGDATFSSYAGATLNGGVMTVTGTVYGGYGSPFVIENGGSLTAGQLVDYYSSYSVLAGGTVTVDGNVSDSGSGSAASSYSVNGGTFTVEGIFVSTSDSVYAQNGGKVQLAALQQDVHQNGVTLYVYDSTSSIEIGTAGGAAGGTITIDSGSSVTESGTFYAPTIVDKGALTVAAGETLYMEGVLGGSGSVSIDAGSTLNLYGASASGTDTIAFAGAGGTLELGDDPGLPNGMTLTGWASGENLDVRGVTDAAYVSGSLVLYDNGSTVGSFKVGSILRRRFIRRRSAQQRLLADHDRSELEEPGQRQLRHGRGLEHRVGSRDDGQRRDLDGRNVYGVGDELDDGAVDRGDRQRSNGQHWRERRPDACPECPTSMARSPERGR